MLRQPVQLVDRNSAQKFTSDCMILCQTLFEMASSDSLARSAKDRVQDYVSFEWSPPMCFMKLLCIIILSPSSGY